MDRMKGYGEDRRKSAASRCKLLDCRDGSSGSESCCIGSEQHLLKIIKLVIRIDILKVQICSANEFTDLLTDRLFLKGRTSLKYAFIR